MLYNEDRRTKVAFSEAILRTFGKLDQNDIRAIDGDIDRLLSHLEERYDWSPDDARIKVERFHAKFLARNQNVFNTSNSRVQV
jgi:uncharacterized protein YjbJ (UPF0337 family)